MNRFRKLVFSLTVIAVSISCVLWIFIDNTVSNTEVLDANFDPSSRTSEQRKLADEVQAAVRIAPQSSVQPERLNLDDLPNLALDIGQAEALLAERSFQDQSQKRSKLQELAGQIAEKYQLLPEQVNIQTNHRGDLRLLSFDNEISASEVTNLASNLLTDNPELFRLSSEETLTIEKQLPVNNDGIGSILYGRNFNGIKVNGNDVRVLVTENGIKSVLGQFEFIDPGFDVSGNISKAELTAIASNIDGYKDFVADSNTVEPQIIFAGGLPAFVMSIRAEDPRGRKIEAFVDPRLKVVVKVEENFYDVQVATSAQDLKGNTVDFYVEDAGSVSYMINKTISGADGWVIGVNEFDYIDGGRFYSNLVDSLKNSGPWSKSAVSAMNGVLQTLEYYSSTHGLIGTGAGSKELSVVTDFGGGSEDSAFWYSDTIALGVGKSRNNFAGSIDVIAHEITHGVIEYSSGLRYQNESGALNESFADVFSAMVDREDWEMGEDLGTPVRSFVNPLDYGQPGHIDDFRILPNTKAGDWGGVHVNSGIPNRAFYLLAEGLTKEGLGSSIGKEKAEKLAFTTLINLTRDSDFITAASLMLTSSNVKYGEDSEESLAVIEAWGNVGISLVSSEREDGSPVGIRKKTYKLEAGDDLLIALYPRDGYVSDARDDVFDLYAVKVCSTPSCDGRVSERPYDNLTFKVVENTRTSALNDVPLSRTIPSAARSQDGYTWVSYIGTDGNAYFSPIVDFDFTPVKFDMPERIARGALSRDYARFAFVLENSKDIYIYSFAQQAWTIYTVEGRSYSVSGEGEDVRRVDAISFSVDSDQVVFDYESCRPSIDPDLVCDFVWSIGLLDIYKGFDYPMPTQSRGVDIGFPRLSSIGSERMVYQSWDYSGEFSASGSIIQYDYFTREKETLWSTALSGTTSYRFGWPDYFPQDWGVTYTNPWPYLAFKGLNDEFKRDYPFGGGDSWTLVTHVAGLIHRASYLNIYSEAKLSTGVYDFGNLIKGSKESRSLSLGNSGNQELEVFSVSGSNGLSASLENERISAAKSAAFTITLDTAKVGLGAYEGSVEILSTADRGSGTISVKAFIDIDSDGDGIGNAVDPDDDNDGVKDPDDAYPLISLGGLADFDSDGRPNDCDDQCQGLGMSADLDDDDDSMPDALEIANGLNPLDGTDCPRWYCTKLSPAILAISSSSFDLDRDGLTRAQEEAAGTNWQVADTDGDGLSDGDEVNRSTNPLVADTDGDGLSDSDEISRSTNPLVADSDGDGLNDGQEISRSTNPLVADSDGDTMSDGEEVAEGLDPNDADDCPRWYCGGGIMHIIPAIVP